MNEKQSNFKFFQGIERKTNLSVTFGRKFNEKAILSYVSYAENKAKWNTSLQCVQTYMRGRYDRSVGRQIDRYNQVDMIFRYNRQTESDDKYTLVHMIDIDRQIDGYDKQIHIYDRQMSPIVFPYMRVREN